MKELNEWKKNIYFNALDLNEKHLSTVLSNCFIQRYYSQKFINKMLLLSPLQELSEQEKIATGIANALEFWAGKESNEKC